MLQWLKYFAGSAGASGYSSSSTADLVTEAHPDLRSITAIITGSTSGIGAETARVLAKRGAHVVLPARCLDAAENTKSLILSQFPHANIITSRIDLSSLRSVRAFVSYFHSLNLPLNLLINNAGKFSRARTISEDGIETTFATNYLGHFLLTKLLLKKMIDTAKMTRVQGRIVNVTSHLHTWFSGDILCGLDQISNSEIHYDPTRAYALSKAANILHVKELARILQEMGANVTVNCVHPGVTRTRLTREREGILADMAFLVTSRFLKTLSQAAATTCYAATHPGLHDVTGKYFCDCNEALPSMLAQDPDQAARLWSASETMVNNFEGLGSSPAKIHPAIILHFEGKRDTWICRYRVVLSFFRQPSCPVLYK